MSDLDQTIRQFCERMQSIMPGDVLGPLNSHVPPGFQIAVLDGLPDGSLVFSVPFSELPRIVPDPRGPFRWSDEAETFLDPRGDPHMLIDLETLVVKVAQPSLPALYQKMVVFAATHPVIGIEYANALLRREVEMMVQLDYLLSALGPRAVEDDFVRCCELILGADTGTRLNEREQALLIMVMNNLLTRCLRNTNVVRVVPAVPSTAPSPDQTVQGP